MAALRTHRPEVLAQVEARQEETRARVRQSNALAALFKPPAATPTTAMAASCSSAAAAVPVAQGTAGPLPSESAGASVAADDEAGVAGCGMPPGQAEPGLQPKGFGGGGGGGGLGGTAPSLSDGESAPGATGTNAGACGFTFGFSL